MAKAIEPAAVLMVLETFVTQIDGALVTYHRGDPIEADDPILKTWPDKFGPLVYPHPVKRPRQRVTLSTPEMRAD